jgi:hypothetical protein
MTKSDIEKSWRELNHALGAFEEWAANPNGWLWAGNCVRRALYERERKAWHAFSRALCAMNVHCDLRTAEGAVRYMRRLAPVFLELLLEDEGA